MAFARALLDDLNKFTDSDSALVEARGEIERREKVVVLTK